MARHARRPQPPAFAEVDEKVNMLTKDVLVGGDEAAAAEAEKAAAALAEKAHGAVKVVKLRTPLPTLEALEAYIKAQKTLPTALVMGSHFACSTETPVFAASDWRGVSCTSLDVTMRSPCPVFIVRGAEDTPSDRRPPPSAGRLVAIAVDGRFPNSEALTKWAIANAIRESDRVLLVTSPACSAHEREAERCLKVTLGPSPAALLHARRNRIC